MTVHFCGPEIATNAGLSNAIRCPNVNMRSFRRMGEWLRRGALRRIHLYDMWQTR